MLKISEDVKHEREDHSKNCKVRDGELLLKTIMVSLFHYELLQHK